VPESVEYRAPGEEELEAVLVATTTAFGEHLREDDAARWSSLMPIDRVLAAWADGRPVGTAASWPFELTVPGGVLPAGGVTWCAMLPTHRRRGLFSELMRLQLEDLHERGEPLAILWASEAPIYGRFGYGVAAPETTIDAERSAFRLRDDPGTRGNVRLVSADEALEHFPPLYETRRRAVPGLVSRRPEWWRDALLADPEHWRKGSSPKYFALLELDGKPAGYARYRVKPAWEEGTPRGELDVIEAFATSPESTAELWRYLFGVDLISRVRHSRLDPTWSLFLMVTDPRRLHVSIADGLWLRLVDVEAALAGRAFADAPDAVLEVVDTLLPHNAGRWRVGSRPGRTEEEADVAVDVADLASAYLGAFTFERLAAAGRARELRPGGLARATALFATAVPPACPEEF
jgi:predicted acetyltransferase